MTDGLQGRDPDDAPSPRYGEPTNPPPPRGDGGPGALPRYGESGEAPPYGHTAPQPGVIPLRPLDLGEVYAGAIAVIRANPATVFVLAGGVALIAVLFDYLVDLASNSQSIAVAAAGGFITLVVASVVSGALAIVISDAVLGRQTSPGEALRRVQPRIATLVGVAVLYAILVVVGFVLLIVPGVYLAVALSMATTVAVLERRGVTDSLTRSRAVVRGDWWRVLGYLLLTGVIVGVITAVLTAIFTAANVPGVGAFIGRTLTEPFTAGVTVLLYVDLRIRKENLAAALIADGALPPPNPA